MHVTVNRRSLVKRNSWVHPAPTESRPALAVAYSDQESTSFAITHTNDKKPRTKSLSRQYDMALEKSYQDEWSNAIPKFKNEHLCCCCCCCFRDIERDNDSREMMRKTFPSCLYYFAILAGAIPPPSTGPLLIVTGLWILCGAMLGFYLFVGVFTFDIALSCRFDATCQVPDNGKLSLTMQISLLFYFFPTLLSIVLVQTRLRHLLQSREVRTLISIVGPERIRTLRFHW